MKIGEIRFSEEVGRGEYLELSNGVVVKSLLELLEEIKKMDDDLFSEHVSRYNNDFSEWIMDNYRDEKLALKMAGSKKKKKMEKILERALRGDLRESLKERVRGEQVNLNKISAPQRKKQALFLLKEHVR